MMKKIFLGIFLLISLTLIQAAELIVPRFELATVGKINDKGEFVLASSASADLAISGGYKFGIDLGFSFDALDLARAFAYRDFQFPILGSSITAVPVGDYNRMADRLNNQGTLSFRMIKATARDLFNLPLDLSFFVGEGDYYCTGDEFLARFGYEGVGTDYKGLFYFPTGIDGDLGRSYNGIHGARGTGISLAYNQWSSFIPMLYVYQSLPDLFSSPPQDSKISGDLRFLINLDAVKLEVFGGVSFIGDLIARAGLLAHFSIGSGFEFFLQGGLPGWNIFNETIGLENFFLLAEPRFKFGDFNLNTTIFYHPAMYLDKPTNEGGQTDLNVKFYGTIPGTGITAGVEATAGLKIPTFENFSIWASPFISFLGGGLRWDTKLRLHLMNIGGNLEDIFELFIGVSSSF